MSNETATADQTGGGFYSFPDQYQPYPADAQGTGTPNLSQQYAAMQLFPQYLMDSAPMNNAASSRGAWTAEEDAQLKAAITSIGPKKWHDIAKFVPTRTSKQCRERWLNCLDPNIKKGAFEPWEDQLIIEKQREIGNHWSNIARLLPGRSPGAVKNRWYSGLKNFHQADQLNTLILPQE